MHEVKAFACNVRAGRLAEDEEEKPIDPVLRPVHEATPETAKSDQPEGQFL